MAKIVYNTDVDTKFESNAFLNVLSDFGLSYAKNGELLKYIRKIGSFDETCTRFYSAEIVCALEYLHQKGIIHRLVGLSVDSFICPFNVFFIS